MEAGSVQEYNRRMRIKKLRRVDFKPVMDCDWEPVRLTDESLPDFCRAIPRETAYMFLASGQHSADEIYRRGSVAGRRVGGFDVYRYSPDDPCALNKDWYAVVDPDDGDFLWVDGPQKDREHWLNEIPERYDGVRILSPPAKKSE